MLEVRQLGFWHVLASYFRKENQERLFFGRGQNDEFNPSPPGLRSPSSGIPEAVFHEAALKVDVSKQADEVLEVDVEIYGDFIIFCC